MELSYIARIVRGATLKKLAEVVDSVHEKTGKSKAAIFFDIAQCVVRYGAGYKDYNIFEFYNMNAAERKTYLTRVKNRKLITTLNDQAYSYIFDKKNVFDKRFAEFIGREVRDIAETSYEEFREFVGRYPVFFAKPYSGESGKGIEKLDSASFSSTEELWKYVTDSGKEFGVIEQPIVQHEDAGRIYPCSINCFRIVTLVWKGVPHILYAVFKMGAGGRFIDNLDNGGIACHFDLDAGEITGRGHTQHLVCYDEHPYTGIRFEGYKLPFMDEVKALVKKAALVVPEIRYVGWDVCLTPNGPAIVEGNDFPAYDFPQLPDPDKPKMGLIPRIREFMPEFK